MQHQNTRLLKLAKMAMLTALAVVLVWLVHIPIFPAVAFLEYDPASVPMLLGGFLYGPLAGLVITVVAASIQAFTVSSESGLYGLIMHVIAVGGLVTVSSVIYRKYRSKKGAIVGLILGCLTMTTLMIPANLLVTPAFTGWPVSAVVQVLPWIVLFNLVKSVVNSILAFFLYTRVRGLLK